MQDYHRTLLLIPFDTVYILRFCPEFLYEDLNEQRRCLANTKGHLEKAATQTGAETAPLHLGYKSDRTNTKEVGG